MVLTVFGISHKTATLTEREPFQLSRQELGEAVLLYKRITRVDEAIILASCNRVEFYRAHGTKGRHGLEVVEFYRAWGVEEPERILNLAYRHVGAGAARHLFRVTSGIDSLVLGEEQIRGQVKDAYSTSCAFGGPGKTLHKLFHHAFRVSKRIRSETIIGSGPKSIPGAAVKMVLDQDSNPGKALVIGANETSEIILSALRRRNIETVIVNRTDIAATKLAKGHKASSAPWSTLQDQLNNADLVFTATSAQEPVISREMLKQRKSGKPMQVIDLAVPRDVEFPGEEIDGVTITDLQDLKYLIDKESERKCDQLPQAQEIIEQQVDEFLEWLRGEHFVGGIEGVKKELHKAADEELERFLPSFHKSETKALDAFAHSLIKRFLKIAKRNFEPGDIGDHLVVRSDPAATEKPGIEITFVPALPENGVKYGRKESGEEGDK